MVRKTAVPPRAARHPGPTPTLSFDHVVQLPCLLSLTSAPVPPRFYSPLSPQRTSSRRLSSMRRASSWPRGTRVDAS